MFNALENRVVFAGRRALRIDADGALADFNGANLFAINGVDGAATSPCR